jgi:hypothetical protein
MTNDTPGGTSLDAERARLRAKGYTDHEISLIVVEREKFVSPTPPWKCARACVVGAAAGAVVVGGAAWVGRHAYDDAQTVDPFSIHVFCEEPGVQPYWPDDRSKITFSAACTRLSVTVICPKGVSVRDSWVLETTADGYAVTSDKCMLFGPLNREVIKSRANRAARG